MSKHTPGPWHVGGSDKCTIYDKYGQRIANSFEGVMVIQRSDNQCKENARLIAAAPELLEALEELLEDQRDASLPVLAKARAVIAKARGTSDE